MACIGMPLHARRAQSMRKAPERGLSSHSNQGLPNKDSGPRFFRFFASFDHMTPQPLGGTHAKANLRTARLMCNSIKSGKTEEEAAPALLKSIRERRVK